MSLALAGAAVAWHLPHLCMEGGTRAWQCLGIGGKLWTKGCHPFNSPRGVKLPCCLRLSLELRMSASAFLCLGSARSWSSEEDQHRCSRMPTRSPTEREGQGGGCAAAIPAEGRIS